MARTTKIAVSLDAALLDQLEAVRERTGESRSATVSRALRLLVKQAERERLTSEYVAAYRRSPETSEEVDVARDVARRVLRAVPWNDA